jgi:hypothetical protein
VALDPITQRKLVLLRQLFQRAVVEAERTTSSVSRILAVIGFDLSTETALKAVVASLQTARPPAQEFSAVLNQCDDALSKSGLPPVPDRANVLHVHAIRNDAQHRARYPGASEVGDCRTYTRDALDKLTQQVWGISFDAISLSDLIRHDEIRGFVKEAEAALASGDTKEAVELGANALERSLLFVRSALVGRRSSFTRAIVVEGAGGRTEADRDLLRAFQQMQRALLLTVLGIPYSDYMRFREVAGEVEFAMGRTRGVVLGGRETPTPDEAEFVLSLATDTTIQIEDQVGDLEAPFGREFWF